jgi:hypothetical protein
MLTSECLKANGETVEVNIINLFGFTLGDNIFEWEKIMFKTIKITLLKS